MRDLSKFKRLFAALFLGFLALPAAATTYYVDINSPNPTPPYTDWSIAATNIQAAIDQSTNGDTVLVNDGVYQTGVEQPGGFSSWTRVVINKPITVQSVNGPGTTFIEGHPEGLYAVRCVYMASDCTLIGFTITNGAVNNFVNPGADASGAGICCADVGSDLISNCVITANVAYNNGGGVYQGTLKNCMVLNNTAVGSLSASGGAGVYNSVVYNSVIAGNYWPEAQGTGGGGAFGGILVNCTIAWNSAQGAGGGTMESTQTNCIIYNNQIFSNNPNYTNCAVTTMDHCCTTPLFAGTGNITNDPQLVSLSYICTNSPCRGAGNPVVTTGVDIIGNPWANPPSIGCAEPYPGNEFSNLVMDILTAFTNYPPGYVANFQADIAGPVYATVWNFGDGTIVTNMPFISHSWSLPGSYPVTLTAYNDTYPNGITETLTVSISQSVVYYADLNSQNPVPPYRTWATAAATIQDAVNAANPGSLVLVTNGTTSGANTNHNALYFNGGMTAPNGAFYRVVVTNPITVESVHGPSSTFIVGTSPGSPSAGFAYLTNGAALIGFCLTNSTQGGIYAASTNVLITNCVITHCTSGIGGVISGTLVNCLITNSLGAYGSVASNCIFAISGEQDSILNNCVLSNGGPAYGGILNNCLITHNAGGIGGNGGGAYGDGGDQIVLNNCTISYNTASSGGGAYGNLSSYCILSNCFVFSNSVSQEGGGAYQAQLYNCIVSNNATFPLGFRAGGGVAASILNNCLVISNFATEGGGAYFSQLTNCTLIGNTANSSPGGGGAAGGTLYNCTVVSNSAPGGGGAYNAILNQCTILDNFSLGGQGGGAYNSTLNNCLISSNAVLNAANPTFSGGGGASSSELTNCLLTYNSSATNGGAAYQSTLVNCTVAYNIGTTGGVLKCQANNCILYYNSGADYYPNTSQYPLNYCCTPVLPTNGFFNITSAPLFVNAAGNDFHLQSTSPCINSGNNIYVAAATDLDGNPRIQGGTVDIGAYEYQTPTSIISYAYLQQYGLPTDGSVDSLDLDGSGFTVYQDWVAGLNPTNSASVLVMLPVTTTNTASGIKVMWQSVSGILYNLQRTTNLPTAFSTIQSNITGQAGTTSYTDTSATNGTPYFYRVGVLAP